LFGNLPESFALLDFVPLRGVKGIGAAATFLFVRFWADIGYCPRIVFLFSHKILLSVWLTAKAVGCYDLDCKPRNATLPWNPVRLLRPLPRHPLPAFGFSLISVFKILYAKSRPLRRVPDLLPAKRSLCHRPPGGPDKHRHTVNELSIHSGTFLCK